MPVLTVTEDQSVVDHQKRFQAAVDVIHNLPKNGSYRPSYDVMLRFYSLYKQAVCGPCTASRPGFWDPVGRYKWDAWSRLGEMSSESAMAAYVEEMKKVAQEVIDTMPMNEKTASLFHHFEPLYVVIDDMPRPPQSLLGLKEDVKDNGEMSTPAEVEEKEEIKEVEEEVLVCREEVGEEPGAPSTAPSLEQQEQEEEQVNPAETLDLSASTAHQDSGLSEGLVLTSDSESEIFCDSLDSVEQLDSIKVEAHKHNSLQNGHVPSEPSPVRSRQAEEVPEATQVGAGQGGEGGGDAKGPPMRRGREAGRDGMHHGWRERGPPQGGARWPRRDVPEAGGGAGQGGGDGSDDGGGGRLQDVQVQQQIVLALRRLREDMRSVMERLEVVERLAAAHAENADWRPCPVCTATALEQEEKWWPFNVSGQTTILLLLWPFVAQGLVFLLRKSRRK